MAEKRSWSNSDIPLSEWICGLIGLLLVCATVGFMVSKAVTDSAAPPEIEVRAKAIVPLQNGYLVQLVAVNRGGETAAEVSVQGELRDGPKTLETREVTVEYIPANSERVAGLFFEHDPRTLKLVLSAHGYVRP
jgi:uncharacterized protein (TIGR02588 family)